jgi:hypothetical protein
VGYSVAAQMPAAQFHHIHVNTMNPTVAIDFYISKFDCEKAKFAGEWDGVWAQNLRILFNKVSRVPQHHWTQKAVKTYIVHSEICEY